MKILIIDLCYIKDSLHFREFVMPVVNIISNLDIDFDIIHFSEIEKLKKSILTDYNKIILCGVALKDFEYLNHLKQFEWLSTFNGDILGICAGAQIIGKIFGAKLTDGEEIGFIDVQLVKKDKIFDNTDIKKVYCLHSKSIQLSENLIELARTETCTQIFKLHNTNKNIYGVLFHPEVRNEKIIENFVKLP